MRCNLWVSWFLGGEGAIRVCVYECVSSPRPPRTVCVRGGGAVHCGQAGPLSAGAAGGTPAARGGFWVQPPCPPPGPPPASFGAARRKCTACWFIRALPYLYFRGWTVYFFSCKTLAYCTCSHKPKRQRWLSVAFSPTSAYLALSKRDVPFCKQQWQYCCHHFIFAVFIKTLPCRTHICGKWFQRRSRGAFSVNGSLRYGGCQVFCPLCWLVASVLCISLLV